MGGRVAEAFELRIIFQQKKYKQPSFIVHSVTER